MTHKLQLYRTRPASEYRWRIRARNGKIVANGGESYKRKAMALRALKRLLQAAEDLQAQIYVEERTT